MAFIRVHNFPINRVLLGRHKHKTHCLICSETKLSYLLILSLLIRIQCCGFFFTVILLCVLLLGPFAYYCSLGTHELYFVIICALKFECSHKNLPIRTCYHFFCLLMVYTALNSCSICVLNLI